MDIITLQEAKEKNLRHYYTGKPCKNGHLFFRYTQNRGCLACVAKNPGEKLESRKLADKARLDHSTYYETGKPCKNGHISPRSIKNWRCLECRKEKMKKWRKENPLLQKEIAKKCRLKNSHKVLARNKLRSTSKNQRAPIWLTKEQKKDIGDVYLQAKLLSSIFLQTFVVDHIIPLLGKEVSGLHIPNNLQLLTKNLNSTKQNKFFPELIESHPLEVTHVDLKNKQIELNWGMNSCA